MPISKAKKVTSQPHGKRKKKREKGKNQGHKPQSLAMDFIKFKGQAQGICSRTMFSKHQCRKMSVESMVKT